MAPFYRSLTSSYSSSIVNMSLSCALIEIFSVEYRRDLEMWVMGHTRSLKIVSFDRSYVSIRLPL